MQGREGRAEAWEAKFPERDASVPRRKASQQGVPSKGMPSQGPGDLNVEPTDVYSCPPQEGGYSPSEAPKADPRRTANSERRPQSSRRTPCPRSGDAGRGWQTLLAVSHTALRSI